MRLVELKEKIEALNTEIAASAESALKAAFKEFLDANPNIDALRWTQYTPYFNDGATCEFGVNYPEVRLVGAVIDEDDEWEDGFVDSLPADSPEEEAVQALFKEITSDEIFLAAFGDHCRITVTRDGIDVESYDHD